MSVLTISTFATVTGGRVLVTLQPVDDGSHTYRAECDSCADSSGETAYPEPGSVRIWAQAHAMVCRALPPGYIDYAAKAAELTEQALAKMRPAGSDHDRRMADALLRAAAIYAGLARPRHPKD